MFRLTEPFFQPCVPSGAAVVAHSLVERSGCGKYPHVSFRAGDGRIKQVPLEHYVVAGVENHDDGGVFAALALVDGAGVGQLQVLDFVSFVIHRLVVEKDRHGGLVLFDVEDNSHVAVEHVLVVVVGGLHHPVDV